MSRTPLPRTPVGRRPASGCLARLGFALGLLLIVAGLHAKPFTLDESIKPMRLDLKPLEGSSGSKGTAVQGVTVTEGQYFYVKGHGMMQPIDVILETPEGRDTSLELFLATWDKPQQQISTASSGFATLQFTAYGEFGIRVRGPESGVPYLLTVHAAPERLPQLSNPFVPLTATGKNAPAGSPADGSGQNGLLWAIVALLVVIAGLLVVILRRGKGGSAAALVLAVLMYPPEPAMAETATDSGWHGLNSGDSGSSSNARPSSHNRVDADNPTGDNTRQIPVFDQPPPPRSWEGMTSQQANAMWSNGLKTIEHLKKLKDGATAWDAYQSLDSCMRVTAPENLPEVPSYCSEPVLVFEGEGRMDYAMRPNQNCAQCFTDARLRFNQTRLDLEKLRVIYSCTKKMSNAALAAGDSMAGIHGYSGIIWQGLRYDIQLSVDKLEAAYDAKYPELISKLHAAMIDMSICEAQYGVEDWYDRFGFVYYEFMKDAYKRKD